MRWGRSGPCCRRCSCRSSLWRGFEARNACWRTTSPAIGSTSPRRNTPWSPGSGKKITVETGARMSEDLISRLTATVVNGRVQEAADLTREALAGGLEPLVIVDQGLRPGMDIVGERFSCGELFIPHLVMAGRAMQAGMKVLEPELKRRGEGTSPAGRAVIGTVKGDIHEIGKSLVGIMLTASGFEVADLGVDVPVEAFVAKVRETKAQIGRPAGSGPRVGGRGPGQPIVGRGDRRRRLR